MYIDADLRNLPSASVSRRFGAFVLDKLFLLLFPAFAALVCYPLYLLIQAGVSDALARDVSAVVIGLTFVATLVYGNWLRVWDNGQTLGMSLMNIAIASDHSEFKSAFMNKWFFWVNISTKEMKAPWAGDELEERTDAQLWRGLLPILMYPMLALLMIVVVEAIGRLPFVLWSLCGWIFANGEFNLASSNKIVSVLIAIPVIISFVVAELGFLLAFNKEKRTLGDHFLGIKLVDVRGTIYTYQPKGITSLIGWFMGNKSRELSANSAMARAN